MALLDKWGLDGGVLLSLLAAGVLMLVLVLVLVLVVRVLVVGGLSAGGLSAGGLSAGEIAMEIESPLESSLSEGSGEAVGSSKRLDEPPPNLLSWIRSARPG